MFTKNKGLRLSTILAMSIVWSACKQGDLEFQTFKPKSETALSDLFKDTPAIRAAFSTVEPNEFNVRLDNLIQTDPVMGVKSMQALGNLSYVRPALPQLTDSVSSVVDRFARYYQATPARQAEYNAAIDLVNRLLDVDPKAITDGSKLAARGIRYIGESYPLFPISVTSPDVNRVNEYHFPQITTWQTCEDPGSVFLNSRPESHITDVEGRDALWSLYDVLRTGFCIYANRSGPRVEILGSGGVGAKAEAILSNSVIVGFTITDPGAGYPAAGTVVNIDSSPGPGSGATATATVTGGQITAITLTSGGSGYVPKNDSTPGAYMRNATAVLKNSGDIELRIRNLIYDLQNKLTEYSDAEKRIANWTVNQSNAVFQAQVAVTDYLIDYVYPITRKDFVFNDGKEVLDRESEHLSMKNPGGTVAGYDAYLTEWLLKALYSDAAKLDDLENFSDVETTSKLYVFGKDIVENGTYGINNATSRYPKGLLKGKLFTGSSYTCNCTPAQPAANFMGLLYNGGSPGHTDDGPLSRLAQVRSTQTYINPYRVHMGTRVNSLVTVPANYNGEFYLEAALKNFYYHVLDRYYDQSTKQWALTPEDAQTLFPTDPYPADRNLQSYVAQMQYSMRNMAILDRTGKKPGDPGFSNVPYLTEFLYTIAAADGFVDPVNAPGKLTLQTCLYSMGATDIAADGVRTISMPFGLPAMDSQVTNMAIANNIPASSRNDQPYSTSLQMFAFELISPGRFIPRADTDVHAADATNGKFRGRFSPHQGDIESTNLRTSNWMVAEFALSAWEGYGPYSVKGRAANGSLVKYENDYYTDAYKSKLATDAGSYTTTAFGTNSGDAEWRINGNGNYHIYEMIYRPTGSGDPCWADSQGSTYGYPRYGYIRPQNNTSYWDVSNCMSWSKVRIDFETRDEAIRANVEWNLKYKKYIFVIPMYGYTNMWTLWDNGASFAVFSTIHGNGLWGVTTGKRACSNKTCNGQWNVSGVNMGANGDGYVPNSGGGFITETAAGAQPGVTINHTVRAGIQSYSAGDSMVLMEISFYQWGLTGLLVDVFDQIWASLGDGPVTPAMIKDNFDSVLTLAQALYATNEVISGGFTGLETPTNTATDMAKFRVFYDTFFPTDETTCSVGGVLTNGANGTADLYENYVNGCGVTARDLPPVPKVNPNIATCNEFTSASCIRYPSAYDPATGRVTAWYAYRGPSDGKLTGMLTPLIMLFGTMHEDGTVLKVTGQATDTLAGVYSAVKYTASPMVAGDNRDSLTIRNFCSDGVIEPALLDPGCPTSNTGYRVELYHLFRALASLNESVMYNSGGANNNLPQYNTAALTNIITESAAGLRNGLVPKLTNNKYANIAYIDPLIRDIESIISDNVKKAEDNFELTTGTTVVANMKNKDRLRYFATKKAISNEDTFTATISIGSPATFTSNNHSLETGDIVYVTTTGTLPGGVNANEPNYYYVVGTPTTNTFRLSTTSGGTAINTTGAPAQSGSHTVVRPKKVTVTNPGYISAKAHGLEVGDKIYFKTTGTLVTGITPNEPNYYYVVAPVTSDTFRFSATYGGAAVTTSGAQSGNHFVRTDVFKTNRFNSTVNGTALNSVPINMMKEFVKYLRTLTSDAEIVAAIKAAIPMLNNYLQQVQGSTSQITLTDQDIDQLVSFIRDTNTTGGYSVDSFLDMIVSTKMDDLNTLRSFSFDQFKTLGSYESVFDDMNDKVSKYFDINIKKDILYGPFMLGEPTCPGGSANGFYDHNKDGVWNPGTFTFITAAYSSGTTFTDTANVGGACSITTPVPNIYDKDYYMFDMGGVARNIEKAVTTLTVTDIDSKLDWFYGRTLTGSAADVVYQANPSNGGKVECYITSSGGGGGINFDREIKAFKNLLLCQAYNKKLAEPHYDRNGNNIIEAGEYTDINNNSQYDDENATGANEMNLRKTLRYYLEDVFMPKYVDYRQPDPLSPNKNYIHFAATALEELTAPTLCNAQGLSCAPNSQYLTGDLLAARSTFYASTNFTSAELKSVKNVVGNFLYDVDTGTYTDLMVRTGPHLVTVLQEFQGDYNDLLNMGLEGFKPNGFMTYFSTNLTNKAPYTSLDVLTDIRTLFNTQVMRCYPGITGEYPGGPLHCKKYKALDTFWGQFGLLMDQFSTAAYNKYKGQWQSQMASPYYSRLVSIFE